MKLSQNNNSIGLCSRKVCIIGSGYVGASITYALMMKELAHEIVLIDTNEQKSEAEVLDIRHGIPYMGSAGVRVGEYSDIAGADLIIMTAGRNRRPGESRMDLASDNVSIAQGVFKEMEKHYTSGVVLVVSNPNDIITFKMNQWLGLTAGKVFGTGCMLDESRLVNVIADYVGLSPVVIGAQVIGEHGATQVALWSNVTIAGIHIAQYCDALDLDFNSTVRIQMERKVLDMGSTIIQGKGRTHYGIATCVCYLADAILNRRATISCVSSVLSGEYGITDAALSLPSIVNYNGIVKRLEDHITDFELERLEKSAEAIKAVLGET